MKTIPDTTCATNVGLVVPFKTAAANRLAAVLARAEALATGRDPAADDAAVAPFGDARSSRRYSAD